MGVGYGGSCLVSVLEYIDLLKSHDDLSKNHCHCPDLIYMYLGTHECHSSIYYYCHAYVTVLYNINNADGGFCECYTPRMVVVT